MKKRYQKVMNYFIEKEYLLKSPPEEVYKYLLEKPGVHIAEEVEKVLLDRNEEIINLALAQTTGNLKIKQELYTRNNQALRIAILQNSKSSIFQSLNPFSESKLLKKDLLTKDEFKQIITDKDSAIERLALFSSKAFDSFEIEEVLDKKKPYDEIDELIWIDLLTAISFNPNIETYGSSIETYGSSSDSAIVSKIWLIASTCPVNDKYYSAVLKLIQNIDFDLPTEELPELSDEDIDQITNNLLSEDFGNKVRDKKVKFLVNLLERWKDKISDEAQDSEKPKYSIEYGNLRFDIAARAIGNNYHDEIEVLLKNYPDLKVRQGFYSKKEIRTSEEIDEYYKKDKLQFLSSVIYNDNIYVSNKNVREKVRNKIYNLLRLEGTTYLDEFYRQAEYLSEKNPEVFYYDPLSLDVVEEDEVTSNKPLSENEKWDKIREEINDLNNIIKRSKKASISDKKISEMNNKITQAIEMIKEKIDRNEDMTNENKGLSEFILKTIVVSAVILGVLILLNK